LALGHRQAQRSDLSVGEYVCRAKVIGITWPVPEEIDDAELERLGR
jgi:hypothetical protein